MLAQYGIGYIGDLTGLRGGMELRLVCTAAILPLTARANDRLVLLRARGDGAAWLHGRLLVRILR
ncbi:hypothetical protein GCM10009578_092880 [Streptomyces rhizosphaericus]